jgi:hypothetical protein
MASAPGSKPVRRERDCLSKKAESILHGQAVIEFLVGTNVISWVNLAKGCGGDSSISFPRSLSPLCQRHDRLSNVIADKISF